MGIIMRPQEACSEATLHFMTASRILGQSSLKALRHQLSVPQHRKKDGTQSGFPSSGECRDKRPISIVMPLCEVSR